MKSKFEEVAIVDSSRLANEIMRDIVDVDKMERMLETELSSADLFKIDCAILSSLRKTEDFSRELLKQLESGKFESVATAPPKDILQEIQKEAIMDITLPLQKMFDEIAPMVCEVLK